MANVYEERRVTPQAELGDVDGEFVQVRRCVCGEILEEYHAVSIYPDAKPMPCCGARLIFKQQVTLLELVELGAPITQPPDDHPIWKTPVAQAGPIAVTLRHMRDSMLEQGGTFEIHGYNADGNPLVNADAADATLDGDQEEEEESGP